MAKKFLDHHQVDVDDYGSVAVTLKNSTGTELGTVGNPVVTSASAASGSASIGDGNGTVTTAGTRVQLGSNACVKVILQAHEDNGGLTNGGTIVVGGSTVVAASVGRRGVSLASGQRETFNVSNTNLLFVDSVDNGAKFHFTYEN